MRLRLAKLLTFIVAAAVPALGVLPTVAFSERSVAAPSSAVADDDPSGARVIVKFKTLGRLMRTPNASGVQGKGPQHAATLGQRHGLTLTNGRIIESRSQVVRGDKSLSSAALAARLAADPDVEYAVPDRRMRALAVPSDPLFAASGSISPIVGQWYLRAPNATIVSAINAQGAWDVNAGSASIVVAVVDTGVRFDHPDLASRLHPGYDFIIDTSVSGDGNGRDSDASDPGDFVSAADVARDPAHCTLGDSSWHGTQTSGLIGAQTNNGAGMASVGNNVMVLPVRVLGTCGGYSSDIIAGMLWAGGVSSVPVANPHPARVINLSLGGTGSCNVAYTDAINQITAKGVVVVASAGNDEGLAVSQPANCSGVIAVVGVRHTGTKVGYSSLGPEVAISAPAGNCVNTANASPPYYTLSNQCLYPILTTTNSGATTPATNTYSDGLAPSLGTSFSAPLVAGTAALMLSASPSLTPAQVKNIIKSSARAFPASGPAVPQCHAPTSAIQDECNCTTSTCGAGLLDVAAAVAAAAATSRVVASVSASASNLLVGASVTFDGSASTAPAGGSIASYQWTITNGNAIAAFSGATNAPKAQVVTSGAGSVTVQLTVTDNTGQQASSSATVIVNAPVAPTVKLLASASVVTASGSVTFDGSDSKAGAGLTIAAYDWKITSGATLGSFTSATNLALATVQTVGANSGTFTVTLTVTDNLGQQASASSTVSVTAVFPTAAVAASAGSVGAGSSVTFDGSGSTAASGRTITAYQWTMASGTTKAAFSGATNGPTVTVTTGAAGTFKVQLTVTDSVGAQDAKIATVTVSGGSSSGTVGGSTSGSSSGGGGATGLGWLFALALSVGLVARARRANRRLTSFASAKAAQPTGVLSRRVARPPQ